MTDHPADYDPFGDRISVVQDDPGPHDPNHPGHIDHPAADRVEEALSAEEPFTERVLDYWRGQVVNRNSVGDGWSDKEVMIVVRRFLATLDAVRATAPATEGHGPNCVGWRNHSPFDCPVGSAPATGPGLDDTDALDGLTRLLATADESGYQRGLRAATEAPEDFALVFPEPKRVRTTNDRGRGEPKQDPREARSGVDEVGELREAIDRFLAAIEDGFAHWEHVDPDTGERRSGDPKVVFLGRTWLPEVQKLRAALASTGQDRRDG